jgi:hypothetical protein
MEPKELVIKEIKNYDLRFIDGNLHIKPLIDIKTEIEEEDIRSSEIKEVCINGDPIDIKTFAALLSYMIEKIKVDKEVNVKDIIDKAKFHFKIGEYTSEGYHYKKNLGISIQNKDSFNTFKAIEKLVKFYEYSLTLTLKTKTSKIIKYEF